MTSPVDPSKADLAEKVYDATTHTVVKAKREKLTDDNADLANKVNLYQALDLGSETEDGALVESVVEMGAGSDHFHFGGFKRQEKFGREDTQIDGNGNIAEYGDILVVDMGEDTLEVDEDGNFTAYDDLYDEALGQDVDVKSPKWLGRDKDVVNLAKSADDYIFECAADVDAVGDAGILVTDKVTGQTVLFQNAEVFKVDGIKLDISEMTDKQVVDALNELKGDNGAGDGDDAGETPADIRDLPNHVNLAKGIDLAEAGQDPTRENSDFVQGVYDAQGNLKGFYLPSGLCPVDGQIRLQGDVDKFHFGSYTKTNDSGDPYHLLVHMGAPLVPSASTNQMGDRVVLEKSIESYEITIHDVANAPRSDAAKVVTFKDCDTGMLVTVVNAEEFVFGNQLEVNGQKINFENSTFSYDELAAIDNVVLAKVDTLAEAEEAAEAGDVADGEINDLDGETKADLKFNNELEGVTHAENVVYAKDGAVCERLSRDVENLIVNGTFTEGNDQKSAAGWGVRVDLAGWTEETPSDQASEVVTVDEYLGLPLANSDTDNAGWLDLNVTPGNVKISQTVEAPDTKDCASTLRLKFDAALIAEAPGVAEQDNGGDFTVTLTSADDEVVFSKDISGDDLGAWKTFEFVIPDVPAGSYDLAFEATDADSETGTAARIGASLDNVALEVVEPTRYVVELGSKVQIADFIVGCDTLQLRWDYDSRDGVANDEWVRLSSAQDFYDFFTGTDFTGLGVESDGRQGTDAVFDDDGNLFLHLNWHNTFIRLDGVAEQLIEAAAEIEPHEGADVQVVSDPSDESDLLAIWTTKSNGDARGGDWGGPLVDTEDKDIAEVSFECTDECVA